MAVCTRIGTGIGLFTVLVTAIGAGARQVTTPEQVHISFGGRPTSEIRVVWQTPAPTQTQTVEYGTTAALGQVAKGKRVRYEYETGAIAEVSLNGLKAGTTYHYRVGDPTGGWSPVRKFKTAVADPESFFFTAFGDHGVGTIPAQSVKNMTEENAAFHLLLGDISYANGTQSIWDQYLRQIEPMASQIPLMAAIGNHENEDLKINGVEKPIGYVAYLARFAHPGNEQWYTFDYGNARFVSVNSDDYSNADQLKCIDRTLAKARQDRNVKWLIVLQHHPLYGTSKGRGNNDGLIRAFAPLFDRYKVDLVLAGHDHHYERQYPLRHGTITSKEQTGYKRGDGTLYVIQGGGGKSLYDFSDPKPDICAVREKSHGYLRVTVPRVGPLKIEAKRIDGSAIETIEIRE